MSEYPKWHERIYYILYEQGIIKSQISVFMESVSKRISRYKQYLYVKL